MGLRHKLTDDLMIYPGYVPRKDVEPLLLHYGLAFTVGNWSFSKLEHHEDDIVYKCGKIFPPPPYPREVSFNQFYLSSCKCNFFSLRIQIYGSQIMT